MKPFDYKTPDIFTGLAQRPPRMRRKHVHRDPEAIDLFLNDTDQEAGRPPILEPVRVPTVADVAGFKFDPNNNPD